MASAFLEGAAVQICKKWFFDEQDEVLRAFSNTDGVG